MLLIVEKQKDKYIGSFPFLDDESFVEASTIDDCLMDAKIYIEMKFQIWLSNQIKL